jgi:hypothetical protein
MSIWAARAPMMARNVFEGTAAIGAKRAGMRGGESDQDGDEETAGNRARPEPSGQEAGTPGEVYPRACRTLGEEPANADRRRRGPQQH